MNEYKFSYWAICCYNCLSLSGKTRSLKMKIIAKILKNTLKLLVLLGIIFLIFVFSDVIFKYVVHGKSFYNVYLGDKEYEKGNYAEAIEFYDKALELYPKHIKARYNLANIYVNFEDFQSAVKEYKHVLKYEPDHLNSRINMGIVLSEELLEFDQAIEQYKKVVNTKPRFINIPLIYDNRKYIMNAKAVAYYNMGLAYRDKSMLFTEKLSKYRNLLLKAADSYEKSLELRPGSYAAQFNLALTKHLLGLHTDALAGYCRALLISPLDYEAHYNLAVLLREKRMYKHAFEEFKNAGSLITYSGDTYRAAYIYGMLSEVSQMAMAKYGYKPDELLKKLNREIDEHNSLTKARHITIKDLEKDLIKRIKSESICKEYL